MSRIAKKFRLVCVDAGDNNNKFWFADVFEDATVKRKWGRIGKGHQTKTFTYDTVEQAIADTERAASRKRSRRRGKAPYSDIELVEADGVPSVTTAKNFNLEQAAIAQIAGSDQALTRLVRFLVARNIHTITGSTKITYATNGTLSTAVGTITPQMVVQARVILDRLERHVVDRQNTNGNRRFVKDVEDYLRLVPEEVGQKLDPASLFRGKEDLAKRADILDAMGNIQTIVDASTTEHKIWNLAIKPLQDQQVFSEIVTFFEKGRNRNHVSYRKRLQNVWEIDIAQDQFIPRTPTWKLWHGTKASNIVSILRAGLKIVPSGSGFTTGRMYGDGLYFSDQSTKSLNYAGSFWGGRDEGRYFMFLVDVAMGRFYKPRSRCYRPPSGYDSVFAEGGSAVRNNEMIVYGEQFAKIKYLCEFS